MPYPIEKKLVVAVSSRAVFDLEDANRVFDTKGTDAYRQYQVDRLDQPLAKGVAFPFIRRLLRLNELYPKQLPIEVVVLSRSSADAGQRFFRSCKHYGLDISRGAFLSGQSPYPYIGAFNTSIFLSAHSEDVISAIRAGFPAGLVFPSTAVEDEADHELRIAFDFDGVLADDQSEKVYQEHKNLDLFHQHETEHVDKPHDAGPLKDLFTKIGYFQKLEAQRESTEPGYKPAVRIAIVTARNAPSNERLVTSLSSWGMSAAEIFLMGGIEKRRVLEVLKPHIFFDDQLTHIEPASQAVPSVLIPFGIANLQLLENLPPGGSFSPDVKT
jgi:5'-nucleotidase